MTPLLCFLTFLFSDFVYESMLFKRLIFQQNLSVLFSHVGEKSQYSPLTHWGNQDAVCRPGYGAVTRHPSPNQPPHSEYHILVCLKMIYYLSGTLNVITSQSKHILPMDVCGQYIKPVVSEVVFFNANLLHNITTNVSTVIK